MSVSIKKVTLWRKELADRCGALAEALSPLAEARADLKVLMAYRLPGSGKAVFELYPIQGKKGVSAAHAAGLQESSIPVLLVEGNNKPAVGSAICRELSAAGINLDFLVGQALGKKFSIVLGFESLADAQKAVGCIKRAGK